MEQAHSIFDSRVKEMGDELIDHLIKVMMLQAIDTHWKDHLLNIDHLKEGIGLRGYGQKDPKQEYKKEAYNLFMELIVRIREEVVERIYWVRVEHPDEVEEIEIEQQQRSQKLIFNLSNDEERAHEPAKSQKVAGRNDACPCGSGKKYKKCCGK
jgi:preprotein translocase subunit SecA